MTGRGCILVRVVQLTGKVFLWFSISITGSHSKVQVLDVFPIAFSKPQGFIAISSDGIFVLFISVTNLR